MMWFGSLENMLSSGSSKQQIRSAWPCFGSRLKYVPRRAKDFYSSPETLEGKVGAVHQKLETRT